MEFYMPTHIYSETDCISHHGDIFQNYGHKAMIVTGKHSSKINGSLSAVTEQLEKYEIEYILFDEIGSALKVKQLQQQKHELFEALEAYYKVFFLGEDLDEE